MKINIQLPRDSFDLTVDTSLSLDGIWAIMGPSGCGKTSLLRCIAGLEKKAKGKIVFNSQTWLDTELRIFVAPEHRRIGYIFQEARLFPHLTVSGNLQFAVKRAGRNTPQASSYSWDDIIDQCGIAHLMDRNIDKLSGGEKQRVAIARALLSSPELLLMDEPLASLDWQSKAELLPCLKNIHRHFNIPVVMVSHSHEEIARLADFVAVMEKGAILRKGSVSYIVSDYFDSQAALAPLSPLNATVMGHDREYLLTELDIEGIRFLANQSEKNIGEKVRLVISAQEISLVLDDVQQTSVQNKIGLFISGIKAADDYHQLIDLSLGQQKLTALITRKSAESLNLKTGQKVFAHFKASGLEVI
ncbi:molybdenum ABC transporter ATP-binding protein [Endozoicomonas sp. OPT23]|uniref:molybdenum ABC transporter ATP-binding protein n=1 Tax=Endozoicomonas sp. OPT23 TaxID=2072845 RepID=UPI00129BC2D3|nr:molybdenum ABC transporter ATP-binding protein [Endozoicomonas sp. OPT23]MRI33521.1 molybdenum ABC transporter ATP-binding protein [Endozoicomonas sp. OPT23]